MKIDTRPAPHIHYHENTRVILADVILSLLFIYAMAFYYYGRRVVFLGFVGIASAAAMDVLCIIMQGKRPHIRDLSPYVTGMLIPLMMPASVPFYAVVTAAVFGIAVAKHPFGGAGHNVFNPAAAGIAFAVICFPNFMFSYPIPHEWLPDFPDAETLLTNSPAFTLRLGGVPAYDWVDEMFLGNFPGPMGATHILVILACLLYLIFRGTVSWRTPLSYLGTFMLLCLIFPRPGFSPVSTMMYETMSGTVLFGGVFMLADPVTSPQRSWSKALYGAVCAVLLLLFRRYSALEENFVFVLLFLNGMVWLFDISGERIAGRIRRKKIEAGADKAVQKKN